MKNFISNASKSRRLLLFLLCLPQFYCLSLHSSINENCPQFLNCLFVGLESIANKTDARTNVLHIWPTELNNKTIDYTHFFVSTVSYAPTFAAIISDSENGVGLNKWTANTTQIYGRWKRAISITLLGIYQYIDVNDVADIDLVNPKHVNYFSLIDIHWLPPSINSSFDSINAIYCMATDTNTIAAFGDNATLCFTTRVYNSSGREKPRPRMEYSGADDMIIEVVISNFKSLGKQTRYALDMQISSNNINSSSAFTISEETDFDDEYTPGVFKKVYIQLNNSKRGFATWKPVCYKSKLKELNSQTQTITNGIRPMIDKFLPLGGILQSPCFESASFASYNVTLGYPKDKFYSGYSSWTFELGTDEPVATEISKPLTIMLIFAIIVPLLGILIVIFFLIKHKLQNTEIAFQPLIET